MIQTLISKLMSVALLLALDTTSLRTALQQTRLTIKATQARLEASKRKQQQINLKLTGVCLKMDGLSDYIEQTKLRWNVQ